MKDCTCCFYSNGIEVYDVKAKPGRFIEKKHKDSKFFPDNLEPDDVVNIALEVFQKAMKNKMLKGDSDACLSKVFMQGCSVQTAVKMLN